MGALRLAEEPRRRAARRRARAAARWRCARWSRPSSTAATSTTACSRACASCTAKIRDEAQRRAAGRPERANDVKLSRGGIREIEFIVQLLLVVRGGQFPEIRTRSTLRGLQRLAARGLMKPATAERAGRGLHLPAPRRAPHPVPRRPADPPAADRRRRPGLDRALAGPDLQRRRLRAARPAGRDTRVGGRRIRRAAARRPDAGGGRQRRLQEPAAPARWPLDDEALLERLPAALAERTRARGPQQPRVQALRDEQQAAPGAAGAARRRMAWHDGRCSAEAALRFIDWIEPLLRRESYLALLVERPEVQQRLLRLLGLARWPMRYLMQHPGVIDELADDAPAARALRRAPPSAPSWTSATPPGSAPARPTRRRCSTRCAAPTTPRCSAPWCATSRASITRRAGGRRPVGAGRRRARLHAALGLGAPEAAPPRRRRSSPSSPTASWAARSSATAATWTSCSCTTTTTSPTRTSAAEVYGAFVRKLITWLTLRTAAGELFDIDTALRPNGNSGLLVTSIDVVRALPARPRQQHRLDLGTPGADARALLRRARRAGARASRPCAATCWPRRATAPRCASEVQAMRDKVRAAQPVRGRPLRRQAQRRRHDGRRVRGAVPGAGARRAHTRSCSTTSATSRCCSAPRPAGLLPAGVGEAAANAYRELRRAQHRARLDEQPTQFARRDAGRRARRRARAVARRVRGLAQRASVADARATHVDHA